MKKISSLLMCLVFLLSVTFAQAKQETKQAAGQTTAQSKTSKAPRLKKDGTPDKRFKGAHDSIPPATMVHMKKNGKPDMRFKANKATKKS